MNKTLFDHAGALYDAKDYRGALRTYTACLKDTSVPFQLGEIGLIYHHIGNCLVKLKNPAEAIKSYAQASADASYAVKGALQNNIGMAYASLRDYENAVAHFQQAVDDPDYEAPYKAYMGMGNAQLKLGRGAEAGMAFREAALDEANPDPAKALLNLGVCFMSLNRPEDAISSYKSALDFAMSKDTRNRLNASMGQAYAAAGDAAEAVEAFNRATADGSYTLSDSASVDYRRCTAQLSRGDAAQGADMSGLDVSTDGHYFDDENRSDPFFYAEDYDENGEFPGYVGAYDDDGDRFFTATEDELVQISKGLAKKDRKRRNVGLKILVVIIVLIVLVLGAAVFAYTQGYGWPTQQSVVEELFADPQSSKDSLFADSLSAESVSSMLAPVIQDKNVDIDGVNRNMSDSVVFATATTSKGGQITYRITLVRNLIGWKISGIELYFPSQNTQ